MTLRAVSIPQFYILYCIIKEQVPCLTHYYNLSISTVNNMRASVLAKNVLNLKKKNVFIDQINVFVFVFVYTVLIIFSLIIFNMARIS